MTYRQALYSIQTTLKRTFDDAEITEAHILYWISVVANKYISRDIEKKNNRSDVYLSIFAPVTVSLDTTLNQHYIDLPKDLIVLDNDSGVEFVSYNYETCCCKGPSWAQVNFSRTYASELQMIYQDEMEKPSPKQPYFSHISGSVNSLNVDRLYFHGTECINLKEVVLGIYCGVNPKNICALDDEIPLKVRYHETLIREVISLGQFMLLLPEDRINEGRDTSQPSANQLPAAAPAQAADQMQEE